MGRAVGSMQYAARRAAPILLLMAVFFLLSITTANAVAYVVEHKDVYDEIREMQEKKQDRNTLTSEFYGVQNEMLHDFKSRRSNWRRMIDNRDVVGSKYIIGYEYVIGYDERYDPLWARDTGIITQGGINRQQTVYEAYSAGKNRNLEAKRKSDMYRLWREKEQKEKDINK